MLNVHLRRPCHLIRLLSAPSDDTLSGLVQIDRLHQTGEKRRQLLHSLCGALLHRPGVNRKHPRDLAAWLKETFPQTLDLVEADALKLDWTQVCPGKSLRIVGNLPYNISSTLLFHLLTVADRVIDQHFMLQKEVVDRMVAAPGSKVYGRLSVMLQYRYRMQKMFDVPPGAFTPPPKVTSSIVRMIPKKSEEILPVDWEHFSEIVAAAFNQRRKTLRNALSKLMTEETIRQTGIDPALRAEALSVEDFVKLARAL